MHQGNEAVVFRSWFVIRWRCFLLCSKDRFLFRCGFLTKQVCRLCSWILEVLINITLVDSHTGWASRCVGFACEVPGAAAVTRARCALTVNAIRAATLQSRY